MRNKTLIFGSGLVALTLSTVVLVGHAQTQTTFIPSGSMLPNLPINSTIQVQPNPYRMIADVKRGDVITETRVQNGSRATSIKRVIGLPGDQIVMNGMSLKINGRALPHKTMRKAGKVTVYLETNGAAKYPVQYGDNFSPTAPFRGVVPQGKLFCLGDNRDNSYDSRHLGSVSFGSILGKKAP